MSQYGDEDLRDVFRLLYDGEDEDWAAFDENDHPPLDSLVPNIDIEVERVEDVLEDQDDYLSTTYSRKRFRSQLDALLITPSTKKRRIYTTVPPQRTNYYHSSHPLPPLPSTLSFEPFSPLAYLARLRTFHPSTYSPFYPQPIRAEKLALNGWYSASRDGLACGSCEAGWGVGGLLNIKDGRVREEIGRRLGEGMVGRHKDGCGWKVLSCQDNMMTRLRNTLHPPIASNIAFLADSLVVSTSPALIGETRLYNHLSEKQAHILSLAISRHSDTQSGSHATRNVTAQLALFGWAPHPLSSEIISCRLCQRRVGLWAFGNGEKALDPAGEHLSWCPLAVEGWWNDCGLLKGGNGNVGNVTVGKDVKRKKWLKSKAPVA